MTSETHYPPLSAGVDLAIEFRRKMKETKTDHHNALYVWLANRITEAVNAARSSSPTPDGVIKERGEVAELVAAVTDLLNNSIEHPIGDEYAIHPDDWDKRPGDSLGKQIYRSRWMLRDRVRKALGAMSDPSSQESGVGETEGWEFASSLSNRDAGIWEVTLRRTADRRLVTGKSEAGLEAAYAAARELARRAPVLALAEGCCSAVSPCSHQRHSPYTICDICQQAHDHSAPRPSQREG